MGLFDFLKKKEKNKQEVLAPTTKSIYVTDYTTGESKTTESTTTGGLTTTKVTHHSGPNVNTTIPEGFSGKVEELNPTGETVATEYYYGNQEVGRLSGGKYTTDINSNKGYRLGFTQGTNQETANLTSKDLTISQSKVSFSQSQNLGYDYGFTLDTSQQSTSGLTSTSGKTDLGFDKYTITSGAPVKQEFGVPIVTQAEAVKYGINPNKSPVWVLSSTTPDLATAEFLYAATTPTTTRPFNTKDLVISNLANIKTGQEIFRLGSTGGQVDTQAIYSKAVVDVRAQYKTRPFGERALLYGAGIVQGGAALGIKTTEFVTSATTTLLYGKPTTVSFGGTLGQVSNYPIARSTTFLSSPGTYIKESLSSPNVVANIAAITLGVGSVVKRASKVGTYEAITETASYFSPVSIKSGVYAPDLANTEFNNIRSIKYTNQAGVSSRIFSGSSGSIQIYGAEKFIQTDTGVMGAGNVITRSPFIEIRAGGGIVKTGIRSTLQPYTYDNLRTGGGYVISQGDFFNQVSPSVPGSTTSVLTSKGITSYDYYQGGSTIYADLYRGYYSTSGGIVSPKETAVRSFASGKATAYYGTTTFKNTRILDLNTGQVSQDFIYSPTGKYKVTPQFKGKEINLNALLGNNNKGYTLFRGGGSQVIKTTLATTFAPQVNTNSLQLSKVSTVSTSPTILSSFTKSSGPSLKVIQGQNNILTSSTVLIPAVLTTSIEQTRSKSRSKTLQMSSLSDNVFSSQIQNTAIKSNFMQGSRLSFITAQAQTTRTKMVIPFISTSSFNFNSGDYPKTPSPTNIPLLNFGGGSDIYSGILQGGKKTTGYTPSFSALVLNIRGTYSGSGALSKSGIDFRPITPGFKFKTGLDNGVTRLKKFFKRK